MNDAPLVHIVVLNYRNYDDTIASVRALRHTQYPNFKVIVVENGSDNDSEARLREALPDHEIIQNGTNLGYSGGNNVGLRRALDDGAEFVVILNPDTLVRRDFLAPLVACARSDPTAGVLGALVLRPDGTLDGTCARRRPSMFEIFWNHGPGRWFASREKQASQYEDLEYFREPTEVDVVSGACLMLRATMLEEIGLLDDRTFLYWEEFILAEKLRSTRFRTVLVPDSRVEHEGGGSVRTIRSQQVGFWLKSLDLYLSQYRDFGFLRRRLIMAGPAFSLTLGHLRARLRRKRPTP